MYRLHVFRDEQEAMAIKVKNTCGQIGQITKINRPGKCVSVNMLESPHVGFIAHMRGRLTKKRYRYATVFVDHFSDLNYVQCMSKITSEETIYANKSLRVTHIHLT